LGVESIIGTPQVASMGYLDNTLFQDKVEWASRNDHFGGCGIFRAAPHRKQLLEDGGIYPRGYPLRFEQQPLPPDDDRRESLIIVTGTKICRVCGLPQRGQTGFQPDSFFWIEANASNSDLHFSHV
jgi:hypothetical protein